MTEHYQQISFSIARLLCLAVYWAAEMIWCKSNFLDVSGAQFILEWFDFAFKILIWFWFRSKFDSAHGKSDHKERLAGSKNLYLPLIFTTWNATAVS